MHKGNKDTFLRHFWGVDALWPIFFLIYLLFFFILILILNNRKYKYIEIQIYIYISNLHTASSP